MVRNLRIGSLGQFFGAVLCFIRQRIQPDLLDHGEQAVATGGREVVFQSDLLDEIEIGIEYLLRCMSAEHADEQGDDALHYQRVTFGRKPDFPVIEVGL